MAYGKKLSDMEKKAKMTALKSAHETATEMMKSNLNGAKKQESPKLTDPPDLKKHTESMSKESGIDFKNDSDEIEDPQRDGNVIGRHISDANDDIEPSSDLSVYDIDLELERLQKLRNKR